jgi:hypothetical protein
MVADQLWWLPAEEEVQKGVRHPVQKAAGQYLKMRWPLSTCKIDRQLCRAESKENACIARQH